MQANAGQASDADRIRPSRHHSLGIILFCVTPSRRGLLAYPVRGKRRRNRLVVKTFSTSAKSRVVHNGVFPLSCSKKSRTSPSAWLTYARSIVLGPQYRRRL